MFIGWLKFSDVNELVQISEEVGCLMDGYHVKLMIMKTPYLCYGAYDEGNLIGAIMAVNFEKSSMIKYFLVKKSYQKQGIGKRLFETLFRALQGDRPQINIHTTPELEPFFNRYGLNKQMDIGRFLNVGKVPPFNFTNAHAKELDSSDFESIVKKIDKQTFNENRLEFLFEEMDRNSSLKFTLPHGFQHSSVINSRYVHLGPWQVLEGYEEEAQKMMRGVLYFRGLKKIIADVPLGVDKVVKLYESYHFQKKQHLILMSNMTSDVHFENIYAFSL